VPEGDRVIPLANKLQAEFDLVVATQDWHPPEHASFAANHPGRRPGDVVNVAGLDQVLWPVHCVQHTRGAELAAELNKDRIARVFHKGTDPQIDSYSGFFDNGQRRSTGLGEWLKEQVVDEVYVLGLATDYCVRASALDARRLGLATWLIADACRGVNLRQGDVERAIEQMRAAGVRIVQSHELPGVSSSPEVLASGRFIRLLKRGRWEYVDRINASGAAIIAAVTPENRLLLLDQFRVPLGRRVIEMPAGLVGDEDDAHEHFAEAARRELLEETGYEADEMIEVAHGPPTAGMATELVTLFVARGLRRVHAGGGTEHEDIRVHEVPLEQVPAWLKERAAEGMLIDPKVYAGLYFLEQFRSQQTSQ
jgi:nicotinamidase/pyrazinamidase